MSMSKKRKTKVRFRELTNEEALREYGPSFSVILPKKPLSQLLGVGASAPTLQISETEPAMAKELRKAKDKNERK